MVEDFYFDTIQFGAALALLESVRAKHFSINDDCFSRETRLLLSNLQKRVDKKLQSPLLQSIEKGPLLMDEKLLEDYFIFMFFSTEGALPCKTFFRAVTSSFTIYEKFCTIYKDYLDTQNYLQQQTQKQEKVN